MHMQFVIDPAFITQGILIPIQSHWSPNVHAGPVRCLNLLSHNVCCCVHVQVVTDPGFWPPESPECLRCPILLKLTNLAAAVCACSLS